MVCKDLLILWNVDDSDNRLISVLPWRLWFGPSSLSAIGSSSLPTRKLQWNINYISELKNVDKIVKLLIFGQMHINNAVCILEIYQVNRVYHPHYLPQCTFCLLRKMTFSEKKKKPRKIKWNQNLDFYSSEISSHSCFIQWYMIYSHDQEFDIWSEIVSGRYADSLVTQVPTKDRGFTLLEDNVLGLEWLWSLILVLQSHLIQSV